MRGSEQSAISGSTILVTGGTGSFGAHVAMRLTRLGAKEIRIFSRDEKKQWEMRRAFPDYRYVIGDVRDLPALATAMRGVDYVFHAAALKQVLSCESFPLEAVKTNTLGAANVCEAAWAAGVRVVVGLSTDKAVKPVNAMGMSKALMEKILCTQNMLREGTRFCCVRYGNVMGTRGSVIPLFMQLIRESKSLPITVPEMTRFLLTLDEAVDLVLHALASARGGEVFVRKAPACRVIDLARALTRKYSALGVDHPMHEIGIRSGEKLHEVLVNEYEMQRATENAGYFIVPPDYAASVGSSTTVGTEYTSANTVQIGDYESLSALLDKVGQIESYQ